MKITHNSATGKTTITLSWTETRQLISVPSLSEKIRADVEKLVKATAPKVA